MHHLMVELYSFDDVGQGYDIAQRRRGPDRGHAGAASERPDDLVLHAHAVGHLVEYGWGGARLTTRPGSRRR